MSTGEPVRERLQKVLARAGVGSRRRVEELIEAGEVTVNGKVAKLGDRAHLEHDAVKVSGRRVQASAEPHLYLLLHKPRGFVSTRDDPEGRKTVLDLLPPKLRRVLPVGRLDFATEGLLLLTDDGDLAQLVAHPRYGCTKTYEAKVKGRPSEAEVEKLRHGIVLEGRRTAPAQITAQAGLSGRRTPLENSWWRVVLSEGRTRQIREMFLRIGHPVTRLRRIAIGPLTDPGLPLGAWRELTEKEVEALRRRRTETPSPPKPTRKASGRRPSPRKPSPRQTASRPSERASSAGRPSARTATRPSAGKPPARTPSTRSPSTRKSSAKTPSTRTKTPSTRTKTPSTRTKTPSTRTKTPSTKAKTPSTRTKTPSARPSAKGSPARGRSTPRGKTRGPSGRPKAGGRGRKPRG